MPAGVEPEIAAAALGIGANRQPAIVRDRERIDDLRIAQRTTHIEDACQAVGLRGGLQKRARFVIAQNLQACAPPVAIGGDERKHSPTGRL